MGKLGIMLLLLAFAFIGARSGCDSDHSLYEFGASLNDTGTVQWTPDGSSVVFSGGNRVAVVDATGTSLQTISGGPSPRQEFLQDGHPRVSPDGTRLAYRTYRYAEGISRQHRFDIVVSDLDGSNHRRLTSGDWDYSNPTWSPDGSMLAYVKLAGSPVSEGKEKGIYLTNADGSGTKHIFTSPQGWGSNLAWSPDGRMIAFHESDFAEDDYHQFISAIAPDGTGHRRIYTVPDDEFVVDSLAISPSGDHIAFVVKYGKQLGKAVGIRSIDLTSGKSTDILKITYSEELLKEAAGVATTRRTWPQYIESIQWSSDGKEVIYSGISHSPEFANRPDTNGIHAVRADGSGLRTLVKLDPSTASEVWPVALSPDGSRFAVLRTPWNLLRNNDVGGVRFADEPWYPEQPGSVILFTMTADGVVDRVLVREYDSLFVADNQN